MYFICYVGEFSSAQKWDFEEFCAAAINVHDLEGMESWEQLFGNS
ncbi:unnamed protein product [Coffea canephora]|uniref:DH200=94 genomic scaffold, scaffold_12563 n=1 Tax=Coffea canephora TaxID=49390 RepID=A0A068VNS6_COFCA|nr:unnamed protein product [Coffea canephora]